MIVNRSAPRAAVVPVLVYEDVDKAIGWLCDTLGFTERLRAGAPGGRASHAQLVVGGGAIMIGRQGSEFQPPTAGQVSQYVIVHVEDVEAHHERARQRGARILHPRPTCRSASGNTRSRIRGRTAGRSRNPSPTCRSITRSRCSF